MATTTPNIGLTLPVGTDGWKRSVINGNFSILDTKIGAVGNTPLQTQINTLSSKLAIKSHTVQNVTTDTNASFNSGLMVADAIIVGVNATVGTGFITVAGVYNGEWVMQVRNFANGTLKTNSNIGNIEILYRDR